MQRLSQAMAGSKEALELFWPSLDRHFPSIQEKLYSLLQSIPGFAPLVAPMSPVYRDPTEAEARKTRYRQALLEGNWEPNQVYVAGFGERFAAKGVEFADFSDYLFGYRQILADCLEKDLGPQPKQHQAARQGMEIFLAQTNAAITAGYLKAKQDTIRAQSQAILELSTPVLKIRERLLVAPLIGLIDSQRARQVSENLLSSIRSQRALAVVLDISGVPVVDSQVANHLLNTAKAAKLMGAEVLFTGISAEIAESLVHLGASLGDLPTFASLETGLKEAERLILKASHAA